MHSNCKAEQNVTADRETSMKDSESDDEGEPLFSAAGVVSHREVLLAAGLDRYAAELSEFGEQVAARFAAMARDMDELQEIARDRPGLRVVGQRSEGSKG
jgi:hypothetical protein